MWKSAATSIHISTLVPLCTAMLAAGTTVRRYLASAQRVHTVRRNWLPPLPPFQTQHQPLLMDQLRQVVDKEVRGQTRRGIRQLPESCECDAPPPTSPQMGTFRTWKDVQVEDRAHLSVPGTRGAPEALQRWRRATLWRGCFRGAGWRWNLQLRWSTGKGVRLCRANGPFLLLPVRDSSPCYRAKGYFKV